MQFFKKLNKSLNKTLNTESQSRFLGEVAPIAFFKKFYFYGINLIHKRYTMMKFLTFLLTPVLMLLPLTKAPNADFNESLTADTIAKSHKVTISDEIESKEYRIKKIVIDAGHGGHDSGCESDQGMEKKNTLAIALKLGKRVKELFPNIDVVYTRTKDEFIELHERANIANKAKADLFISIHCNSTDGGRPLGTETYVLGMHKMEENLDVAKRENSSILLESDYKTQYDGFDPNSNEAYIIFSLYQNAYLDKSILFAKNVEESFKINAGRKSLGVKQAGFVVLRQTAMPSVLIETGFLNNPTEGAFISSEGGQETMAESIFLAFKKYKKSVETKDEQAQFVSNVSKTRIVPPVSRNDEENIVFKIQLATSNKDVSQTPRWKNVENLEVVKEGNVYKYYRVALENYSDASSVLKKVKASGYSDAFIVAFKNGKRVGLDEVKN
jgi:N-acetylmuramoyl-L-alanine amidase